MVSSFTSNYGIEEMATGEQSGAWGTTSNYNWDIVDRLVASTSVALSDASTATLQVAAASPTDGASNVENGMYRVIKFTGALSQACTITIAPNDTKAYFIIDNATTDAGSSGPYNLVMKQGSSGATVTIQNGKNTIIYCDGAGATNGAVANALSDLQITTLECTGAAAIDGAVTAGSTVAATGAVTASAGVTTAKEDSAANTVLNPITIKRTTSHGTPAAGIGAGAEFITETAAGNNETGSVIESVTTNVSSGAEVFDLVFKNMTAGSAAAEVGRMTGAGAFSVTGGTTSAIEDSGTTTVIDPLTVQRTSSGSPAAGIGAGIAYVVETAAGNNETGVTIDAVTTDVSSTAEDFDLVFNLMTGGATAAEKLRIVSSGKVAFANSAYASVYANATSTGAMTLDFDTYQNFYLTATGNVTLSNPTTESVGQSGVIIFEQDGTGSRTLSIGTQFYAPGASLTISTAASAIDVIPYFCWAADKIALGTPQLALANVT
jgi:hypothetical protein